MPSEHVILEGHIIDSLTLPRVLDEIVETGNSFEIVRLRRAPDWALLTFLRAAARCF